MSEEKPTEFIAIERQKPIEFYAYERLGPDKAEFEALVSKLMSDDDTKLYDEHNGAFFENPGRTGYTVLEMLPFLVGLPWNNLALAYIRALHPSNLRVSRDGVVCTDAWPDRVTVFLAPDGTIARISQEVTVSYGCGADVGQVLGDVRKGQTPSREPPPNVMGDTKGLEKIDFS